MASETLFGLVVEDDPQVRALLCHVLASEGFEVSAASCCRDAKQVIKDGKPHLVLLDLGLPGGDGLELGGWIRANYPATRIIILSGRGEVRDRIAGLESCADDYVPKPFDVQEVTLRIRNLMRRDASASAPLLARSAGIPFEGWLLSEDDYALTSGGREVKLTVMEFLMLKALVTLQGRVATRGWLLDQLNADMDINERTIDYHVCTLRIKLRKAGLRDDIIASVRGVGYKYTAPRNGVSDLPSAP